MIEFIDLTVRNFLSYGNIPQTLKLNSNKYQVVVGFNKDKSTEGGKDKNGCGKSSLGVAIHYALFGTSINNSTTLPSLVNNINKKNMEVKLRFNKNGTEYTIHRGRNPNFLKLTKNGEEITDESLGDSRNTQEIIESILGFDDDIFTQLCLITNTTPIFLDLSSTNQKSILEKVLGVDVISEKIILLKELIKQTKNDINQEQFKYDTIVNQNKTILSNIQQQLLEIDSSEKVWKENIGNSITTITQELDKLNNIDITLEEQAFKIIESNNEKRIKNNALITEMNSIKNQIDTITPLFNNANTQYEAIININFEQEYENHKKINDILTLKQELDKKIVEKNTLNTAVSSINKETKTRNEQLDTLKANLCPFCKQPIDKEESDKLKNKLVKEVELLNAEYHKLDLQLLTLNDEIEALREKTEIELPKTYFKSLDEAKQMDAHKDTLKTNIDAYKQSLDILNDKLKSIVLYELEEEPSTYYKSKNELFEHKSKITSLNDKLNELKNSVNPFINQRTNVEKMKDNIIEPDDTIIKQLTDDQYHQEYLLKLLNSPTSHIRKSILDKSLAFLNDRIKFYLNKMESTLEVTFNNDMTTTITSNGLDYSYISSGEKGRINFALTFAFKDVWETLNDCNINLLYLDEVCDCRNLDIAGIELLTKLLMNNIKSQNVFVVSHNESIIGNADKILAVTKSQGFSTFDFN